MSATIYFKGFFILEGVMGRYIKSKKKRFFIFERDNWTCKICGFKPKYIPSKVEDYRTDLELDDRGKMQILEIDHIFPYVKGGRSVPSNLQTLCNLCNCRKGDRCDD